MSARGGWLKPLQSALTAVVHQHDALHLRFLHTEDGWQQMMGPEEEVPLELIDVRSLPLPEQHSELEKAKLRLQSSLDFVHGPLLRVAYIPSAIVSETNTQPSARVLIAVHHLAPRSRPQPRAAALAPSTERADPLSHNPYQRLARL